MVVDLFFIFGEVFENQRGERGFVVKNKRDYCADARLRKFIGEL